MKDSEARRNRQTAVELKCILEGLVSSFSFIGGKVLEVNNKLDTTLSRLENKENLPLFEKVKTLYEEFSLLTEESTQKDSKIEQLEFRI